MDNTVNSPTPDRTRITDRWCAVYNRPPPKYLSAGFMQNALAWEAQAKTMGGHCHKIRRRLKVLASGSETCVNTGPNLKPGVVLVREWNGRTYQVNVLEQGFQMDNRDYTSLTAIAKKITGAKWSGPRFFGLTGQRGARYA